MKTFRAYWSESFSNSSTYTKAEDFFCNSNCYHPEDIAAIQALEVGQQWEAPHYGHHHTVTRLT